MAVEYDPAREVGGDLYDFEYDSTRLRSSSETCPESRFLPPYMAPFSVANCGLYFPRHAHRQALEILNNNLVARYRSGNYIAMTYCTIDPTDGSAILANGGMPFPFLVHEVGYPV